MLLLRFATAERSAAQSKILSLNLCGKGVLLPPTRGCTAAVLLI